MDMREEKGLVIAATSKIEKNQLGMWKVPSQSGNGTSYVVSLDHGHPFCNCPDFEKGNVCKHIHAVEFVSQAGKQARREHDSHEIHDNDLHSGMACLRCMLRCTNRKASLSCSVTFATVLHNQHRLSGGHASHCLIPFSLSLTKSIPQCLAGGL